MNDIVLQLKQMKRAMRPYVLMIFEMIIESDAKEVLSLGVRQAQAERTILSALHEKRSGKLTSIDLQDRTERVESTFPELLPYWNLIVGNTHDESSIKQVDNKKYDLLLIDAGHSYEDCKKDYEMYSPLVKKGGYILMHDIYNPNETMKDFWKELENDGPRKMVGLSYGFAGMGLIVKD